MPCPPLKTVMQQKIYLSFDGGTTKVELIEAFGIVLSQLSKDTYNQATNNSGRLTYNVPTTGTNGPMTFSLQYNPLDTVHVALIAAGNTLAGDAQKCWVNAQISDFGVLAHEFDGWVSITAMPSSETKAMIYAVEITPCLAVNRVATAYIPPP